MMMTFFNQPPNAGRMRKESGKPRRHKGTKRHQGCKSPSPLTWPALCLRVLGISPAFVVMLSESLPTLLVLAFYGPVTPVRVVGPISHPCESRWHLCLEADCVRMDVGDIRHDAARVLPVRGERPECDLSVAVLPNHRGLLIDALSDLPTSCELNVRVV